MQEYSRTATDADWSHLVGLGDSCTETGERNTPPLCCDAEYLRSSTGLHRGYVACMVLSIIPLHRVMHLEERHVGKHP